MNADLVRPKRPEALSMPDSNSFSTSIEIRTESSPGSGSFVSSFIRDRIAHSILIDV